MKGRRFRPLGSSGQLSIARPSGTIRSHLERAYDICRKGNTKSRFRFSESEKAKKSVERAERFVKEVEADPYEFMRILFLSWDGAYPYQTVIGSEWAFETYKEMFGCGPSMGLKKFLMEKDRLSQIVLSLGTPLDEAVMLPDFSAVSKVIHCSEEILDEMMENYGEAAAHKIRWDRDLKEYLLDKHEPRAIRNFQSSVATELSGPPVEVGPRKAASRQRGNIPN